MASGTIVKAWKDGGRAYLAVRVAEADGATEYIGEVALADLAGLTAAQQKAKLVEAVKAERDKALGVAQGLGGISGSVTL